MSTPLGRRLKARLQEKNGLMVPGAANALAARVIHCLGFEAAIERAHAYQEAGADVLTFDAEPQIRPPRLTKQRRQDIHLYNGLLNH